MKNVWKGLTVGVEDHPDRDKVGRRTSDAADRTRTGAKHLLETVDDKLHDT